MRKIHFILLILIGANTSFAQSTHSDVSKEKNASSIYIGYNSSVIYPGLRAGIEIPISQILLQKSNAKKQLVKDRFFTTNIGWYHHPTFHDNLYLTFGYTMRRTKPKGFFTEFSPELGYSRTFLSGTCYQVDENDKVSIKKLAGYNYALISLGGGLGYDFSATHSKPIAVYSKLNILTMFPYNSTFYARPTIELGIIYTPKELIKFNTRVKKVIKK